MALREIFHENQHIETLRPALTRGAGKRNPFASSFVGLIVVAMADQDDHKARLDALERRLAAKRAADAPKPHMEEHYSQAQHAWRMVVELVAGLGIGFVIGYGLDMVLGTKPFLMVVFTLLGFAAGVKTVIRTAQELQTRAMADQAGSEREGD